MCSVCSLLTQPLWHGCTSSNLNQNLHFSHRAGLTSQTSRAEGRDWWIHTCGGNKKKRKEKERRSTSNHCWTEKPMRLHLIPAVLHSLKTKQQHSSKGSWETWQASCETGSVDTRVTGWWESDAIWQSAGLTPQFRWVWITYLCTDACTVSHLRDEWWTPGAV